MTVSVRQRVARGFAIALMVALARGQHRVAVAAEPAEAPRVAFRAVLVSAADVTVESLQAARDDGFQAVVVELTGKNRGAATRDAAALAAAAGLDLYYWIEVARCPELADTHPLWMASLQGHEEWRRHFPDFPRAASDEVVKVYPWVPIVYAESFAAQLERVGQMLDSLPPAKGVFLNDLQAAPSACGCGNVLCRWTADYGPTRTATPLGPDAAAQFIEAVERLVPRSDVIPVWTTECEEHDTAADGACEGVPCFRGRCWQAYTEQLMPVTRAAEPIAVLLPYRALGRDLAHFEQPAGWVGSALESFDAMPQRHGGDTVAPNRLIAVLQGWDVDERQIEAQIQRTVEARAGGYVVARRPIDQSWEPRIVKRVEP